MHIVQAPAQRAATMGAFKHSYPAPTIIKAKQQQSATVIVMHGLGDTAAGWAPVGQQLAGLLPHVKWVFPTAPTVRPCPAVMRAAVDTTATKRLSEVTLSLTTKGNLALGWSAKQQWRRNRLRIAFQVATKNVLITTHGLGHVLPCSATHAYDTMSEVHGQGHPSSALQFALINLHLVQYQNITQVFAQRPISVNMGMPMPGWFDIHDLGSDALDRTEDADGIKDAAACAPNSMNI